MNNNTGSRRPSGPVRQHSLQQPPRRQQQIRQQRSTEDEKIYSTNSVASRNKFSNSTAKCDHHHHHMSVLDRPKVRVAWSEQPGKLKNDGGVEIVARQIPTGKSGRPATGRNRGTMGRCSLGEKATILYSRQELAERLRLAWKQREENKSNIDIFLAHNTVEERCDSRMSTGTNRTALSTPGMQKKNEDSDEIKEDTNETHEIEVQDSKKEELECNKSQKVDGRKFQTWFSSFESNESAITIEDEQVVDDNDIEVEENKENDETPVEEEKKETVTEKKSSISINCHDWNASITINSKNETINSNDVKTTSSTPVKEPDYSQARLKRASYQSGLNKAFVNPVVEKPSTPPRITSRISTCQEPSRFRRTSSAPPQRRTQVNIVIDTPSIAGGSRTTDSEPERQIMSANEQPQSAFKCSITTNRPIKSAPPAKRRSKSNKRRGLSMALSKDGDDGNDVVDDAKGKGRTTKGGKIAMENKSVDVVTMVSLVSSADSESEMDENSPRDDKLICELRNKLPTTPIIKSSNGLSGGMRKPFKSVSFQQDSFDYGDSPPQQQQQSQPQQPPIPPRLEMGRDDQARCSSLQARFVALTRASSTSVEESTPLLTAAAMVTTMTAWKSELIGPSALPLLQLQQTKSGAMGLNSGVGIQEPSVNAIPVVAIEAPLTDREKRCLAVPIGDIHDKKRKLVRCRSAVTAPRASDAVKQLPDASQTCLQAEVRMSQVNSQASVLQESSNTTKVVTNPLMPTTEANLEKIKNLPAEPYCQTEKEKECWHLYRRMCDKGVFVSFDTVLRGMLTPTEYRLRQKEMSQNC